MPAAPPRRLPTTRPPLSQLSWPRACARESRDWCCEFIEQVYNRLRLRSELGYRSPEEFEQQAAVASSVNSRSATIEFFENKYENKQGDSTASPGKGATSPPSPDPLTY